MASPPRWVNVSVRSSTASDSDARGGGSSVTSAAAKTAPAATEATPTVSARRRTPESGASARVDPGTVTVVRADGSLSAVVDGPGGRLPRRSVGERIVTWGWSRPRI
jgi:hypothetical protein